MKKLIKTFLAIFVLLSTHSFGQNLGLGNRQSIIDDSAPALNESELWAKQSQIATRKAMLEGLGYNCNMIQAENCLALYATNPTSNNTIINFVSTVNTRGLTVSYVSGKNTVTEYLETREVYNFHDMYEIIMPEDLDPRKDFTLVASAVKLSKLDVNHILKVSLVFP